MSLLIPISGDIFRENYRYNFSLCLSYSTTFEIGHINKDFNFNGFSRPLSGSLKAQLGLGVGRCSTCHSSGDVAGKYGVGFSLQKRYEAINSVDHPWLKI